MDELVQRLSEGNHPVEAGLRPEKTVKIFKECIDRGYIHIKFTDTQGGTELGVRLDQDDTDLSKADFDNQTGSTHLVGRLTLNYVKVRCIADIELATLDGTGYLEPVEE
jgi:Core binding factor beta subunit